MKPIRYIVINPGQTDAGYSASYNSSLGADEHGCNMALHYARQTAGKFGGEIFVQFSEGEPYLSLRARQNAPE